MSDTLGPLPEPHLHAAALKVMNAGLDRGGHVYSAEQMRAYALAEVQRMLERCVSICQRSHDIDEAAKRIESLRQGAVMDDFHNKRARSLETR